MGFPILLNVSVLPAEFMQLLDSWNFFYEIGRILKSFFSPRWSGFDPRTVHVEFVVEIFSLGQVFFLSTCFPLPLSHNQFFMLTFHSSTIVAI
jgi:hypothetical protein